MCGNGNLNIYHAAQSSAPTMNVHIMEHHITSSSFPPSIAPINVRITNGTTTNAANNINMAIARNIRMECIIIQLKFVFPCYIKRSIDSKFAINVAQFRPFSLRILIDNSFVWI